MPIGTKRQKQYANTSRAISVSSQVVKHPLNVRPSGNSFFGTGVSGPSKNEQMGYFSLLPEELFMEMLDYVDDSSALKALSHTSRVLYAYLYDEDFWKRHYTRKVQALERQGKPTPELKWRGSWRLSVLQLEKHHSADLQMPGNLLCSDILYRPFQCSQINYHQLFAKVIEEEEQYHLDSLKSTSPLTYPAGRVERLPEAFLTLDEFHASWHSRPFILVNAQNDRWPRWDLPALLHRFADVKFRQEAVQWPLSLYSQYLASNCDESPLYLFDCNSKAMQTLRQEYSAPQVFQHDVFKVFGDCRPDHAWLIIGSSRSGSTFHKDPNYTSAWNTALSGRKLWVMLPPGVTPPGVSTDDEESEVTSPVGIAEWVLSGFYNDASKMPEARICITFPSECMYVPSGWWHTVINLDDSVALTQNFVPEVKLGNALFFLKHKNKQVSGFRPLEVRNELQEVVAKYGQETDSDMQRISEYCSVFDRLNLQDFLKNEDCGEIMENELPPLPVYELFKKLLEMGGHNDLLQQGLQDLERKEKVEHSKTTGKSEAWTQLTESSGFSFGFAVDEE